MARAMTMTLVMPLAMARHGYRCGYGYDNGYGYGCGSPQLWLWLHIALAMAMDMTMATTMAMARHSSSRTIIKVAKVGAPSGDHAHGESNVFGCCEHWDPRQPVEGFFNVEDRAMRVEGVGVGCLDEGCHSSKNVASLSGREPAAKALGRYFSQLLQRM